MAKKNVKVAIGDGTLGYAKEAPYDGIIVTCGAPGIPTSYVEQLKMGGKIVIPIGSRFSQMLSLVEKKSEGIRIKEISGCVFVPLIGKDGWEI